MPLFQPSNVRPSMLGPFGSGVIRSTYPSTTNYTTFSWQVNGTEPMTAFQIDIYQSNDPNTLRWSSGKLTAGCPFYPTDANGNPQLFSYTVLYNYLHDPSTGGYTGSGLVSGRTYLIYITQYWGVSPDEESIVMTSPAQAITRGLGYVTYSITDGVQLTGKSQTITATYTNTSGGAGILNARWQLWLGAATNENLIVDTGWLNTQQLTFAYDGYMPGNLYTLQCLVESTFGLVTNPNYVTFTIAAATETWDGEPSVCIKPSGVLVSWNKTSYIPATVNNGPILKQTIDNDALLVDSQSLTWNTINGDPMSLPVPIYGIWEGYVTEFPFKPITFTFQNGSFSFTINANTPIGSREIEIGDRVVVEIELSRLKGHCDCYVYGEPVIENNKYVTEYSVGTMYIDYAGDGTLSKLLYGDNDDLTAIYVRPKTAWNNAPYKGIIGYSYNRSPMNPTGNLTQIELSAPQDNYFLWLNTNSYEYSGSKPSWDDDGTVFLYAPWTGKGNNAGNINLQDGYVGTDVYRNEVGSPKYYYIGSTSSSETSILDVSAKANTEYQYSIFVQGHDTFIPKTVTTTPCFADWMLFSCTQNSDGSYTPVELYRFRYNVESGSMSNNNAPSVLQNFTRYPTVLLANPNYKSGVLNGYIGKVTNGNYSETVAQRDALFALSNSSNALFLKNRKGDFLRVRLSAPLSAVTADNTWQQMENISLPWVEVADTEGDSVVLTESDPLYADLV